MNKDKNIALADDIAEFVVKNSLGNDIRIYFNNICYDWKDEKEYGIIKSIKASDYFEYANDDTVSMSFEGAMYHIMNYGEAPKLLEKFNKIFKKHNCYYEFGDAWNLTVYYD